MLILRVEHAETRMGPYGGNPYGDFFAEPPARINWPNGIPQPLPRNDGIPFFSEVHRFGFQDMTGLLDWFGHRKTVNTLEAKGFLCVKIRVRKDEVILGNKQLAFVHRDQPRSTVSWMQVEEAAREYGIR